MEESSFLQIKSMVLWYCFYPRIATSYCFYYILFSCLCKYTSLTYKLKNYHRNRVSTKDNATFSPDYTLLFFLKPKCDTLTEE